LVPAYTEDDLSVATFASLYRVLERAPVERKLSVFGLMGKCAAEEVSAFRQHLIDDLWAVAVGTGLVSQLGTTSVQHRLAAAFSGGA
jgi:hypothetical protein